VSNRTEALNKVTSRAHAAVDAIAGVADDAARMAKPAVDRVSAMANDAVDKAAGTAALTADWVAEQARSLKSRRRRRGPGSSA
jgi:hypothetical protein